MMKLTEEKTIRVSSSGIILFPITEYAALPIVELREREILICTTCVIVQSERLMYMNTFEQIDLGSSF